MLIPFFLGLKEAGVPVSLTEFLALLEGLRQRVAGHDVDDFYVFARTSLVKDERYFDRFDRAFATVLKGVEASSSDRRDIPEEWLRQAELTLQRRGETQVEALGGWDKLMETLRERLREQKGRHQGGSKMDRHSGHVPFRRLRLQPRGRAHRPG